MTDVYDWFDPYEQKERAEREARRADYGVETGRRQVEETIARATRNHLSEKVDMAVAGLAERIAHCVAVEIGAKVADHYIAADLGERMAATFRRACSDVIRGLEWPERSRVRLKVDRDMALDRESMTIQYETLGEIRVAYTLRL